MTRKRGDDLGSQADIGGISVEPEDCAGRCRPLLRFLTVVRSQGLPCRIRVGERPSNRPALEERLGKSGIRLSENIFNRGPVAVSGGHNVLFRNDFRVPTDVDVTHVTSMRMIADLSDWSSVLWLNSPGQSGHLASRHYDDAIDAYVKGEYFVHPWTLEEIRARSRRTLLLQPGG